MYGLLRILFWTPILIFVGIKIKRYGRKKYIIWGLLIIFVAIPFSYLFPIENLFITFSTPEKSYNYVNSEEVRRIIPGENTDLVIGEGSSYVYLIVPKTDKGWKVGRGLDTKNVSVTYKDGIVVEIYQYKDSNEFYVEIENLKDSDFAIADNVDSEFYEFIDRMSYKYYGYVYDLDESYELYVNGEKMNLVFDE